DAIATVGGQPFTVERIQSRIGHLRVQLWFGEALGDPRASRLAARLEGAWRVHGVGSAACLACAGTVEPPPTLDPLAPSPGTLGAWPGIDAANAEMPLVLTPLVEPPPE